MDWSDPQGHYDALNLSHGASQEDILRSYRLLKQAYKERREGVPIARIQAAFETLSDLEARAEYDQQGRPLQAVPRRMKTPGRQQSPLLLAGLLVVLMGVLAVTQGPAILAAWVTFQEGDHLYLRENDRSLGVVKAYESEHHFHNGAIAPAYLLESTGGGEQTWYPARDLARISRRAD